MEIRLFVPPSVQKANHIVAPGIRDRRERKLLEVAPVFGVPRIVEVLGTHVGVQTIGELIMERAYVTSRPSGRFQHCHLMATPDQLIGAREPAMPAPITITFFFARRPWPTARLATNRSPRRRSRLRPPGSHPAASSVSPPSIDRVALAIDQDITDRYRKLANDKIAVTYESVRRIRMDTSVSRRKVIGALAASAMPAASYTRILGANDRIQIGELGVGHRASGHRAMLKLTSKTDPKFDVRSVCDLWSVNRERAAADVQKIFGGARPRHTSTPRKCWRTRNWMRS